RLSRVRRSTSCPGSSPWRHHSQVRNSPWATFFDGVTTTRNISAAPLQPAGYQLRFCRQQAGLGRRRVLEKVRKRASWIQRQQRFFTQFRPRTPERQYVSGETHLYLGRQYKLKVVADIQQQVKLYRGRLVVQSLRPKQADTTRGL